MARTKSATLNLRIDAKLKDVVEKAAADDCRSITSLVEKLLVGYLREQGYLRAAPRRARSKQKLDD